MQTEPDPSAATQTDAAVPEATPFESEAVSTPAAPPRAEDYLGAVVEKVIDSPFWGRQLKSHFGMFPIALGISIIAMGIAVLRRHPHIRTSATRLPGTPTLEAPLRKKKKS